MDFWNRALAALALLLPPKSSLSQAGMDRPFCRGHVAYSRPFSAVTSTCRTSAGASLALHQYFSALDLSKLPVCTLRYISSNRSGFHTPEHHPVTVYDHITLAFNSSPTIAISLHILSPRQHHPHTTPSSPDSYSPANTDARTLERENIRGRCAVHFSHSLAQDFRTTNSSNGWTRRRPLEAQSHQVPKGLQDLQEEAHPLR